MNPLISVIIPVYNVETEYLIACIESVLNQTYSNLEILLIDDHSSASHVLPLFRQYKQKDSRVIVIAKEINEGVSMARQQGIDTANGQYLFFLDGDDTITPDCVASLLEETTETDADMVIGDHWLIYKNGYKVLSKQSFDQKDTNGYLKALLTGKCGGIITNSLIKTEKIRQLELPNIYLQCNDTLVCFVIAGKNFKIKCLGKPVYNWIQRATSATHTKSNASLQNSVYIMKWINNFVKNNFNATDIENELAYYNLSVWALLLVYGIKKTDSSDTAEYSKLVYTIYWKNKWAKNQLNFKDKLVIQFHKNDFLSIFYKIYAKGIKPFLNKRILYKPASIDKQ